MAEAVTSYLLTPQSMTPNCEIPLLRLLVG